MLGWGWIVFRGCSYNHNFPVSSSITMPFFICLRLHLFLSKFLNQSEVMFQFHVCFLIWSVLCPWFLLQANFLPIRPYQFCPPPPKCILPKKKIVTYQFCQKKCLISKIITQGMLLLPHFKISIWNCFLENSPLHFVGGIVLVFSCTYSCFIHDISQINWALCCLKQISVLCEE